MTLFRPWSEIAVQCRLDMNVPSKTAKKIFKERIVALRFQWINLPLRVWVFERGRIISLDFYDTLLRTKKGANLNRYAETKTRVFRSLILLSTTRTATINAVFRMSGCMGENKNTFLNSPESCSVEPLN